MEFLSPVKSAVPAMPVKINLPDLCDDVLLLICQCLDQPHPSLQTPIKHLSFVNQRLHTVVGPYLFKNMYINAPIKTWKDPPSLRVHAHRVKVDLLGSLWWWSAGAYICGDDAMDLIRFLHELKSLRTLELSMMKQSQDIFRAALGNTSIDNDNFTLRTIETLQVTRSAAFLASHCPNLQNLTVHEGDETTAATAYTDVSSALEPLHNRIPPLEHLNIKKLCVSASWSPQELSFLTTTFPNTTHLSLNCTAHCYHTSLTNIVNVLGKGMPQLHTLHLNKITKLGFWFHFRFLTFLARNLSDAKTPAQRETVWRDNEEWRVSAENNMARVVFGGIRSLKEVCFGEGRIARLLPRANGAGGMDRWMWERTSDHAGCTEEVAASWVKWQAEKDAVIVENEVGM